MNLVFFQVKPETLQGRAWLLQNGQLRYLGDTVADNLARTYADIPCVLFIPSQTCLMSRVAVTAAQRRQLTSMAWLAEEISAEDPEQLHVIALPAQGADATELIVTHKAGFRLLLTAVQQSGLKVLAVLPDIYLLPHSDSEWQVMAFPEDIAALRLSHGQGGAFELSLLLPALEAAWEEVSTKPQRISAPVSWHQQIVSWCEQHELECQPLSDSVIYDALTVHRDWSRHPANLLQGEFASRREWSLPKGMRWLVYLLLAAPVAQLISDWAHWAYYQHQHKKIATEIVSRYMSTHPQARLKNADRVSEVRKRLKSESQLGNTQGALVALTRLATVVNGRNVTIQRIDVGANGKIVIDADAASAADLENIRSLLAQQGFRAELLSANTTGNVVRGRLNVIEAGGEGI